MKLTGIIEDVFRGVTIFRGYATLRTLAKLSSSTNYQREKDEKRVDAISEYIRSSSYVFFPELILGWQIDNPDAIRQIKEEENASSIVVDNGIKIRKAKFRFKSLLAGEEPKTKVVTIEIPDTLQDKIFNRIDGNHRLSVVDKIFEETGTYTNEICEQVVPFCLIIQNASDEALKSESAYFYLINSKAKVLKSEENLRVLFRDNLFTDTDKEKLLTISKAQIDYIHGISDYLKSNTIDFVQELFTSEIYSFSHRLTQLIIGPEDTFHDEDLEQIKSTIKYINCLYNKGDVKIQNQEIFFALIEISYKQQDVLGKFVEWINKNEVGSIENLKCEHIVQLFNNIHRKRAYQVFVAMPYISFKRVNEYNKLFKEVLEEISKKEGFGLELIPIMRFRGEAQRIDRRLIDCIKQCDIFIGDLSTVNDNVIFEVGLAEGCNKKILLIRAEEDTSRLPFDQATLLNKEKDVPFDLDKLQYIPYSNSGYYNDIKSIMRNNIPVIVAKLKKENYVSSSSTY